MKRCAGEWGARAGVVALLFLAAVRPAGAGELTGIRVGYWDDRVRVVCDLTDEVSYRYRVLTEPHRIAIDLRQTSSPGITLPAVRDWLLERIRLNRLSDGTSQVVLDLTAAPSARVFELSGGDQGGQRIVCDLFRSAAGQPAAASPWVVAVDAGHGGRDPGAVSRSPRLHEKEIVLECGEGSITIRKDGKIVIKGTHLLSRAAGVNRIKGGQVNIN